MTEEKIFTFNIIFEYNKNKPLIRPLAINQNDYAMFFDIVRDFFVRPIDMMETEFIEQIMEMYPKIKAKINIKEPCNMSLMELFETAFILEDIEEITEEKHEEYLSNMSKNKEPYRNQKGYKILWSTC